MPDDNDLTYNLSISGNTLTFMDSNGRTGSVDLPLDNDRTYSLNLVLYFYGASITTHK